MSEAERIAALADEAEEAAARLVRTFNFGDDSATIQILRECATQLRNHLPKEPKP